MAREEGEDYDLCIKHKMEKPGLGIDDESNNQQTATTQSPGDSRRLSIQRCIQSLVYACQCHNANCSLPSCQKMKTVVQHFKGCKRKTSGGCRICKQLIALCCHHAKHCQKNKCQVPFCLNIKHKLKYKMEKPGLGIDVESNNQQTATTQSPGDSHRLSIQRCIQSLVHACQCHDANCSLPPCQKMKRVVQHTKGCKHKTNGGCRICKQLIALCCYHAKHCQENKCPVPFCLNIKHKLRQQQL